MLEELRLASLGVIDEAVLELGPGFTVITGETGAGKTMVVTALQLLLGARADSGLVRSGTDRARVEGRVRLGRSEALRARLAELDADVDDDSLILSRVLSAEGRSRAVIGGTAVPVGRLAEITDRSSRCTARLTNGACCAPHTSVRRSTATSARRRCRCSSDSGTAIRRCAGRAKPCGAGGQCARASR